MKRASAAVLLAGLVLPAVSPVSPVSPASARVASDPPEHYRWCQIHKPGKYCLAEDDELYESGNSYIYEGDCFWAVWDSTLWMSVGVTNKNTVNGDHDHAFEGMVDPQDGHASICPPSAGIWKYTWMTAGAVEDDQAPSVSVVWVYVLAQRT